MCLARSGQANACCDACAGAATDVDGRQFLQTTQPLPARVIIFSFPNRPPLHTEELPDADPELRLREFALIYATYMTYLACRRNYGFWLPSVLTRLGKTKGEAGAIGSSFEMSYGACSLLNGVLIDAVSPRKLLISGLLLTGLINLCVGEVDYLPAIALLWASNGAVQSVGWPSVTNIFLAWFPDPSSRGAWYSLLSTCQNAGAALVPLVVAAAIAHWMEGCVVGAGCALGLHGACARSVAIRSPAEARRHARAKQLKRSGGGADDASNGSSSTPPPPSSLRCLHGASPCAGPTGCAHRSLWVTAINYFGVSLVRSYLSDWSSVYLTEAKGLLLSHVARCLFSRGGGFGGSLAAGAASDSVFRASRTCGCDLPAMLALHPAAAGDAEPPQPAGHLLRCAPIPANLSQHISSSPRRRHLPPHLTCSLSPSLPFPLASLRAPPSPPLPLLAV